MWDQNTAYEGIEYRLFSCWRNLENRATTTRAALILTVAKDYGFLDPIVAQMIKQSPADRPASILDVKRLVQHHRAEAINLQKLSQVTQMVIPAGSVDEPLAHEPPVLVDASYDGSLLTLLLDRPVNIEWIRHCSSASRQIGLRTCSAEGVNT